MTFSLASIKLLLILTYFAVGTRAESGWTYSGVDFDNWNQTCIERVNATLFPKCRIYFLNSMNTRINVTCMDDNEFRVKPNATQSHTSRYDYTSSLTDLTNTYKLDSRPFPNARIECSALFPLDFDFDGVGALTAITLELSKMEYTENVTHTIQVFIRLAPETTGNYIFQSIQNPDIQTSFYLIAERGEKPFLIGEGTRAVEAKKLNATTTVLPCVSSDLNVDVTLFRKGENSTWAKLNESESLEYDRKQGLVMNSALPGDYRCFTGTDEPTTSTDYVEIKVQTTEEEQVEARMAEDIHIEIKSNTSAVCYSTGNRTLTFLNLRSTNPTENRLLRQCLRKKNEYCGVNTYHRRRVGQQGYQRCPDNSTSCLSITNLHPSGILYCDGSIGNSVEEYYVTQNYFTGLDYKTYTNWSSAPQDALIKPSWTPNATSIILHTGRPYKIGCNFVSSVLRSGTIKLKTKHRNGTLESLGSGTKYGFAYYLTPDIEEFSCSGTVWGTESVVESSTQIDVNGGHHHMTGSHCDTDYSMCKSGDQCYYTPFRCDGDRDCRDGSDDDNCPACRSGQFHCANGSCLRMYRRCNNVTDCADGSDEQNCPAPSSTTLSTTGSGCGYGQFKCATSGICIRENYKCDGDFDCGDGSDEADCPFCRYDRFRCTNGTCLRMERKCNNVLDCSDGIDESKERCQSVICSTGQVKCKTGQCIYALSLCDGAFDCLDKSDEDQDHCSQYYPTFIPTQTRVTFLPSTFNELVCKVNSMTVNTHTIGSLLYFKPRIDWWRRGHNISGSERVWDDRSGLKSSLRFENITEEDKGEYVCMATNRIKSVSQVYFVTVEGLMTTSSTENPRVVSHGISNSEEDSQVLLRTDGLSAWAIAGFVILALALVIVIGAVVWRYFMRKNSFNGSVRVKLFKNEEAVLNGI